MNKTVWVLTGPTASGKTAFSIRLAHEHNCEIVCMDSMQIYRGMDIGTAKPTAAEMGGIPHHMLDVVHPDEPFSVARYQEMAEECIEAIQARGKRALLVGGTGMYLRALRQPMTMGEVAGDDTLRAELEAIAETEAGKLRLHAALAEVDPVTAAKNHPNQVRRVIRALEVYRLTGIPFSQQPQIDAAPRFRYRVATLTMERAILYSRIEKRIDLMIQDGLVDEVRRLLDAGYDPALQSMQAIGYKELVPFIRGEGTLDEATYLLKLNTRHYAKRQLTWMRRETDVKWVEALADDAYNVLEDWYTKE